MQVLETRARLTQQEFEARVRTEAVLQQLASACRQVVRIRDSFNCARESPGLLVQVGELEKREVKAGEELEGLRSEVGAGATFSKLI